MIALPLAILWFGGLFVALLDGTRRPVGYLAVGVMTAAMASTIALGVDVYRIGEREMLVAFSEPTRTNVSQVVVTGPGAPPIATVDDLSGQEIFVR